MADRRQVGISDGWRGQAPSRRKVVNRRSSCLRRHQRRLKTDPMCRSKTDPPGHDRTGYQPSVRRLSLLPATCRGTRTARSQSSKPAVTMPELLVTIPESSNPRRRNRPGPIAGTSGHDHRNTHTSLVGPFAAPESRPPSSPTGRQPRIQEQPRVCERSLT